MEDLVPSPFGCHSSVGRATNRGMDKMREMAVELEEQAKKVAEARKEAALRIAAERKAGSTGAKPVAKIATSPSASGNLQTGQEESTPTPKKKSLGSKIGSAGPNETPMGRAVRERLNLNPGSPAAVAGTGADASPGGLGMMPTPMREHEVEDRHSPKASMVERSTSAFTCLSPDDQVFSENARTLLGRFFLQGPSREPNPDSGKYKVLETCTRDRVPVHDFNHSSGHKTRGQPYVPDKCNEFGPEDLTSLDFVFSKSGSMFVTPSMFSMTTKSLPDLSETQMSQSSMGQTWKGGSLMSAGTKRPALNKIPGARNGLKGHLTMTELRNSGDAAQQDRNTSSVTRQPECDLMHQTDRKPFFGKMCEHFEAGKYAANHDAVKQKARTHTAFTKQLSRSATVATKDKPPAALDPKGTSYHPDRSRYRHNAIARGQRMDQSVMDMTKDTDRPPLITVAKPLHDENDPLVVRLVHERAMSLDANAMGRAVERRSDSCLNMSRSITRDRAGNGARIAQNDVGFLQKTGRAGFQTTGQLSASVEKLKDSNRIRGDLGMTFDQHKFRKQTKINGVYSSLFRPRDHAAPDFARTVPFTGFATSTPVRVLPRSRSHDAMPGWSAEAVDGLMTM